MHRRNPDGDAVKMTLTSLDGEPREEKLDLDSIISADEKISAAYVDGDGSVYIALSSVTGDGDIESRIALVTGNGEVRQLSEGIEGNVTAVRLLADGSGYISGCPGGEIRCFPWTAKRDLPSKYGLHRYMCGGRSAYGFNREKSVVI